MNTATIDNPLSIAVTEISVDTNIQQMLVDRFTPFLEQTTEWRERAEALVVTDIAQTREMKMAREARLALREIRINADKLRKELKEDSLRYGRAVQAVYNVIESQITPIEKHLEAQEKFKELHEMKMRDDLRKQRESLVADVRSYIIANVNFGEITEDDFMKLWTGAKLQKQAEEQAARDAEAMRIAKQEAEAMERERLRVENERLKAEAEAREKERRAELDRIEMEMREANIKAAKERQEAERLAAELKAKQDAEARAEAERQAAAEAVFAKNDKAKIADLINDLTTLKTKYVFRSKKYKLLYFSVTELLTKIETYINSKN
jgi:hypothetical protein